jgi:hypothetical protein
MNWARRDLGYEPPEIDTSTAHIARVYDYLLGGKDNYRPDRTAAEQLLNVLPSARVTVRENRRFLHRLTWYLAAERGIDQFFDIGTGIPTSPNLHEIAQDITPASRVVYVDNDPIVFVHAQARLIGTPEGRIAYIHADLRDPDAILDAPDFRATLDLDRPVALTILSTLHFVRDDDEAHELVRRYLRPLPQGSVLALSLSTTDFTPKKSSSEALATLNANGISVRARTGAEVSTFFDGLTMIEPGVVAVHRWRPTADAAEIESADPDVSLYGAVAVKS